MRAPPGLSRHKSAARTYPAALRRVLAPKRPVGYGTAMLTGPRPPAVPVGRRHRGGQALGMHMDSRRAPTHGKQVS